MASACSCDASLLCHVFDGAAFNRLLHMPSSAQTVLCLAMRQHFFSVSVSVDAKLSAEA
jgi:hypothetical protein